MDANHRAAMEKGVAPTSDLFIYLNSLKLEATLGRYTIIASQANKFDGLSRIYEQMVQYIAVSRDDIPYSYHMKSYESYAII